ncbi:MAG: peptidase C69 [Candidatus Lokiarchaeota archaeon]|nr:peptidase C69 [Candidatus Lokiarchaeota archaeon]MBD3200189.1 peptidase C69 [Candidatus Lokiarchaeota archaeon]
MCDTLVALPEGTLDGNTIFGKNSDRPQNEAQLITHVPRKKYEKGEMLQCTYITIPQVLETYEILLSQPFWMWGAEMGSNEYGVAIGNEAVYTTEELRKEGPLGMDLLRLGLERSKNAKEALNIITELLDNFGQGGSNAYKSRSWYYHNSFIIADPKEAYVLETADKWWISEKVDSVRAISNSLSIRGKGDMRKDGIIDYAIKNSYCKDETQFDFAINFSESSTPNRVPLTHRAVKSTKLLEDNNGSITVDMMMEFLREHEAGLCMHGSFQSTGSQVSHLKSSDHKSIHWFTGSTKPCLSIYKPYAFPIKRQEVNDAGPYKDVDNEWFWSRHKKYVDQFKKLMNQKDKQHYINKIDALERKIYLFVEDLISNEENLDSDHLMKEFNQINQKAWQYAYNSINQ